MKDRCMFKQLRKGKYKRCKNKEILPDVWFCNKHLDLMYNLKIKKSTIKNAGYGLFCGSEPIGDTTIVAEYSRKDIVIDCSNMKDATYVYETIDFVCYDARNTCNLIGRYANDGKSDEINNAEFIEDYGRVFIVSLRNINPGEEIFCSYGKRYWGGKDEETTVEETTVEEVENNIETHST